jgi:hypothetical protein
MEAAMTKCEKCGAHYKNVFQVVMNGETHTFDSFECAIAMLAPACAHCGTKVIGHGVEANDKIFCCNHCAKAVHAAAAS